MNNFYYKVILNGDRDVIKFLQESYHCKSNIEHVFI